MLCKQHIRAKINTEDHCFPGWGRFHTFLAIGNMTISLKMCRKHFVGEKGNRNCGEGQMGCFKYHLMQNNLLQGKCVYHCFVGRGQILFVLYFNVIYWEIDEILSGMPKTLHTEGLGAQWFSSLNNYTVLFQKTELHQIFGWAGGGSAHLTVWNHWQIAPRCHLGSHSKLAPLYTSQRKKWELRQLEQEQLIECLWKPMWWKWRLWKRLFLHGSVN